MQREPAVTLLTAARRGEAGPLADLYERYSDCGHRIALRLTRSATEAEDVLHDVFVGLPEGLRTYANRGPFGGWLAKVTARAALIRLRQRRRRREVSLSRWKSMLPQRQCPDDVERLALERAIEGLSPKLRTVFVLCEIEGLSHREVAGLLGIGLSASQQRYLRAVRALRTALAPKEKGTAA